MSMLTKDLQGDDFNGAALGGVQQNRGSHSIFVSLLPAWCTDAPMISRLKTGKSEGRHRGAQIVALGLAVTEKAFSHHAADTVTSVIGHIGSTVAVSEPTGHRLTAADF